MRRGFKTKIRNLKKFLFLCLLLLSSKPISQNITFFASNAPVRPIYREAIKGLALNLPRLKTVSGIGENA
jgi:hypothetical protein